MGDMILVYKILHGFLEGVQWWVSSGWLTTLDCQDMHYSCERIDAGLICASLPSAKGQ